MRGPGRLYIDGAVSAFGVHVTYRESALTYLRVNRDPTCSAVPWFLLLDFLGETVRAPRVPGLA